MKISTGSGKKYREEKDPLGVKKVPAEAYYGIQTFRAVENFVISPYKQPREIIYSIALIKIAAAMANMKLGALSAKNGKAIIKASREILDGKMDSQFPVDAYQSGAGTSTHMNVNEVIANRANEMLGQKRGQYKPVHPNDHVNLGQSTNDVFPTAMRISSIRALNDLVIKMDSLSKSFLQKGKEFKNIIKSGRTHLQDAVPLTLGNEFTAYGENIARWKKNILEASHSLEELGIGGTAVGNGINTKKGYRELVIKYLRAETGLNLKTSRNLYESMQSMAPFINVSGNLRGFCLDLVRICNDLRLLASGPRTGLNEIELPAVQPGSSIMPGKVNPVIPEAVTMTAFQIIGNDTAISYAAQAGQLELNVMMPLIAFNLLNSIKLLANSLSMLSEKCIKGLKANREMCRLHAERSVGLATALTPYIGYMNSADVAKESLRTGRTISEIVKEKKLLRDDEIEKIIFNRLKRND